jgi:YYY domain-containing protein
MISFLAWYLLVSLVGLLAFPITYRLLPGLPERGYAFSRSLGLLLWFYAFWLLASLRILDNSPGGLVFALILLVLLSTWALLDWRLSTNSLRSGWEEMRAWMSQQRWYLIGVELIFLAAFVGWTIVRAANPDVFGTEKPMELAFINSILHAPNFPPPDPWLSGYAISYYYFGYVIVSGLAMLTGTSGAVAFNLGVALVFALSALGAYGMVYNLLIIWHKHRSSEGGEKTGQFAVIQKYGRLQALIGPFLILLVSNLEGFFEVLHSRGFLSPEFWSWLDIQGLNTAPQEPFSWLPKLYGTGNWWWWRASRVLVDYDMAGSPREIIDEFPVFTFLLADLHPHVLAMPFAFLAMALALNMFVGGFDGGFKIQRFNFPFQVNWRGLILAAIVLGGMAFLNTWDFPFYVALFVGAYVLQEIYLGRYTSWAGLFRDFIGLGIVMGLLGAVLYLPFYIGFSSQAGGPLPNLIYPTRGVHLWVMFATMFVPLFAFALSTWRTHGDHWRKALIFVFGLVIFLLAIAIMFGLLIALLPELGDLFLGSLAASSVGSLVQEAILRRFVQPGALITLSIMLWLVLSILWPKKAQDNERLRLSTDLSPAQGYVLLLILLGALLVFVPEFFYLRDQFGWRINTIFKFYYQAWLIWGVAAAFGTLVLFAELRGIWSFAFRLGFGIVLAMGLVYTVLGVWDKTHGFDPPQGWSLDGSQHIGISRPDELAAIQWLEHAPRGTVAEAVGGSYNPAYARISAFSGQATVLGWPGHESQWRGGGLEIGSRQSDIQRLYCSRDWNETRSIIEQYEIRYIYVGPSERSAYTPATCGTGLFDAKFERNLEPAFQQGEVVVYEVAPQLLDKN